MADAKGIDVNVEGISLSEEAKKRIGEKLRSTLEEELKKEHTMGARPAAHGKGGVHTIVRAQQ